MYEERDRCHAGKVGAGAREGETGEGEVRVPLDPQLRDLVEEGLHYPDDSDGWSLSGPTGDVVDSP